MIGGISYFHEFAYDLLAENERITAATFDAAIARASRRAGCRRSPSSQSSMVFEIDDGLPDARGRAADARPPPHSTYGFQKLATEYFAKGRGSSTGCRTRSCGRSTASASASGGRCATRDVMTGNVKLAMSHVVPDLVQKVLKGQDPLHILGDGRQVRHYTYGGDLARGIRLAIESPTRRCNEDFNLSTATSTTVLELAEAIWRKVHGDDAVPLRLRPAVQHDVQKRVPDVRKASACSASRRRRRLDAMLDEVIPWIRDELEAGRL